MKQLLTKYFNIKFNNKKHKTQAINYSDGLKVLMLKIKNFRLFGDKMLPEIYHTIKNNPDILDKYNEQGVTPLIYACAKFYSSDNIKVIKLLLDAGCNINLRCEKGGYTAFMYLCRNGNIDAIKLLIENGCDINSISKRKDNALMVALRNRTININIIKLLISVGCNINHQNTCGTTPLEIVHRSGRYYSIIRLLIKKGSNLYLGSKRYVHKECSDTFSCPVENVIEKNRLFTSSLMNVCIDTIYNNRIRIFRWSVKQNVNRDVFNKLILAGIFSGFN